MRTAARLLHCNVVLTLKGWRSESPETHGRVLIRLVAQLVGFPQG
jgi:hypothetical protein